MKIKILIILLIIFLSSALIHSQTPSVANVLGRAISKDSSGRIRVLKKGDKLSTKHRVRCSGWGCTKLEIYYCNHPKTVRRGSWQRVWGINCRATKGRRSGPPRTDEEIIISPYDSAFVRPEKFLLRWKPIETSVKFNLLLTFDRKKKILWNQRGIDGSKGSFKSKSLIEKLKELQKVKDRFLSLKLLEETNKNNGIESKIVFRLISPKNQQNLEKELVIFENEPDEFFKSVGRSTTFSKYKLYIEAAEEIEKAKKILKDREPDKKALLEITKLAINLNYITYNDNRTKKLCELLEKTERNQLEACETEDN